LIHSTNRFEVPDGFLRAVRVRQRTTPYHCECYDTIIIVDAQYARAKQSGKRIRLSAIHEKSSKREPKQTTYNVSRIQYC